ncbi:hypothetical protein ACFYKX_26445 [Cytobacillus sp. FJAT-54145]|uniref:Helix-turn-helix domain-containing protein n=1 Tax=Cytobacillus spartinae TaxID=3299023 RepID=A0ABW6KIR3_9BACI
MINDNKAKGKIESYYLRLKRNTIYTSLEDIEDTEWYWSPSEVKEFDELWNKDMPIKEMALELGRSEIAVFLQSLDRLYKGKIQPRNWHFW